MGFVRLLLALSVVVYHANNGGNGFRLLHGHLAVEMFFMISGFYMSLVLTEKYDPRTWRGVVTFYRSRFLRLWPTFALTTVVVWLWSAMVTLHVGRPPTDAGLIHRLLDSPFASAAIELSNIFMIGQDIPTLIHITASGTVLVFNSPETVSEGTLWLNKTLNIGAAWSIGVEIWFYLLIPLLVRAPTAPLVGLMVASGMLRYLMDVNGLYVYFFFPTQLCLFLAGALAHRFGAWVPLHCRTTAVAALLAVVGGGVALSWAFDLSQHLKWVLYAVFAATMYGLFRWSSASSFDRLIGEMSYPAYITHMIVAFMASVAAKRLFGMEIGAGILVALVLPLSLALVLLVERPVARFRARVAGQSAGPAAASTLGTAER